MPINIVFFGVLEIRFVSVCLSVCAVPRLPNGCAELSVCLCCTATAEWLHRTVCLSVLYPDCRLAAQKCLPVCAVLRLSTDCTELHTSLVDKNCTQKIHSKEQFKISSSTSFIKQKLNLWVRFTKVLRSTFCFRKTKWLS